MLNSISEIPFPFSSVTLPVSEVVETVVLSVIPLLKEPVSSLTSIVGLTTKPSGAFSIEIDKVSSCSMPRGTLVILTSILFPSSINLLEVFSPLTNLNLAYLNSSSDKVALTIAFLYKTPSTSFNVKLISYFISSYPLAVFDSA